MQSDLRWLDRQPANQHLIHDDAERVDVRPRVDVYPRRFSLLRTHVRRSSNWNTGGSHVCLLSEVKTECFCYPEVNDLGLRFSVELCNKDVGRFQIAVNDSFLMCML